MLAEFFDGLDSAIRLLKLKRTMSNFANISPKIESLTDRYSLKSGSISINFTQNGVFHCFPLFLAFSIYFCYGS